MTHIKTIVDNSKNKEIMMFKFYEIEKILLELNEKYGINSVFGMCMDLNNGVYYTSYHGDTSSLLLMLSATTARIYNEDT